MASAEIIRFDTIGVVVELPNAPGLEVAVPAVQSQPAKLESLSYPLISVAVHNPLLAVVSEVMRPKTEIVNESL